MRGFVSLLSHISRMGGLLRSVSYSSSAMDFRGRIVWFSVSYSRCTDALFMTIFPLSEAAFAAASHNTRWRYKFQKQIYLVLLFIASYGTVECEFKLVYLESNAFKMWRSYECS